MFPFISLTLTPLVIVHVFTVDVELAVVVKLLIERVFKILTYDVFDVKSGMKESSLKKLSLSLTGYKSSSLINNMGVVFWFMVIFIVLLFVRLAIYIFDTKVNELEEGSKLSTSINLFKNILDTLYNYLVINQIISLTSLIIYLQYEYYEPGCFELTCFISDV